MNLKQISGAVLLGVVVLGAIGARNPTGVVVVPAVTPNPASVVTLPGPAPTLVNVPAPATSSLRNPYTPPTRTPYVPPVNPF